MEDALQALRTSYLNELPAKAKEISELVTLTQNKSTEKNWLKLQTELHRLAGSGGTYGFSEVSEITRYLEEAIASGRLGSVSPPHQNAHLERWLAVFNDQINALTQPKVLRHSNQTLVEAISSLQNHLEFLCREKQAA